MIESRSARRKTYAWVTEADAQICRDALKKAGYTWKAQDGGHCIVPADGAGSGPMVLFGDSAWVSFAECVGVIQYPSDDEMLRPRDSHQADDSRHVAMPDVPEGCSHGPWIDEEFGSWVCIKYGMSLYVHESGSKWHFVEHVSDTIQRRLDALSEETERKSEALNVLAKACNSAASSAQSPSDEFHWTQYWKVCQSAIDGVEAQ